MSNLPCDNGNDPYCVDDVLGSDAESDNYVSCCAKDAEDSPPPPISKRPAIVTILVVLMLYGLCYLHMRGVS